jgi:hypothetical protein
MPAKRPFCDAADADYSTMQLGENGCLEYTDFGIGSDILALSQMVRGGDPSSLSKAILERGSTSEVVNLVILLFVTRNSRGGKGEKKLAFYIFLEVWNKYPDTAKEALILFPHYGYWKDMFLLMELGNLVPGKPLFDASLSLIKEQWLVDLSALTSYKQKLRATQEANDQAEIKGLMKKGPQISLLAKWLPREGRGSDKKIRFVDQFSRLVYPAMEKQEANEVWQSRAKANYRKQVAELTRYLDLPEVLLAAKRADEINFHRVASKATKLLTKAFLNEGKKRSDDPKRIKLRQMFVDHIVKNGLKGGQVMPHEIVASIINSTHPISKEMELALDAQWKDIWKQVVDQVKAKAAEEGLEFNPTQMVPLVDVSGSMSGVPMDVAIALGIGISEITHEAFRDRVLTFETNPTWFRLKPTDTIVQKVRQLQRAPWGQSTDFDKAYDLVLQVCLDNKLRREDMPCLIVFSDMQFNSAAGFTSYCYLSSPQTMFKTIEDKVRHVAQKLGWEDADPSPIVFWNLRNTGGHPVDKDTEGAVLLSGFSPSLLKLVMNGDALKEEAVEVVQKDGTVVTEKVRVTPEEILKKMLDDSLYDPVRKVLGESREGALLEYERLVQVDSHAKEEHGEFELI